ncbi:MAG: CPBP family intramembrane metalloprotease [Candidatus Lokiarchaeota archaeon]|nr:CPBP family intramembrane metalloprotease [Candidatus Lokiarchaeota archaeon]
MNETDSSSNQVFVRKHTFFVFSLLSLVIGFIGYLPMVLAEYGMFSQDIVAPFLLLGGGSPTIAAVITAILAFGGDGAKNIFSGFTREITQKPMIVVAILLPFITFYAAIALMVIAGSSLLFLDASYAVFLPILLSNFLMNIWEEIGWRGFGLPTLQKTQNAFVSSIILGIVWSLWHWQYFVIPNSAQIEIYGNFLIFSIHTIVVTILYTWIYNSTNGNLFSVTLYHAITNTVGFLIYSTGFVIPAIFTLGINSVLAIVVIVIYRVKSLSSEEKVTIDQIME